MIEKLKMEQNPMSPVLETLKQVCPGAINEDGTVDVYFPPDNSKIFTRISNQTPFQLQAGDGVELLLKDGSYSNCWIVAKHGATFR